MNRPVIGAYRKKSPTSDSDIQTNIGAEPEIINRQPKVETPATSLSEGIQEDLQESIDKTKGLADKAKTYEQILSERGITLSKAHAVIDSMLEKGYYEEIIPLKLPTPAPITVTFRTRTQADYIRYLRALELYNPKYVEEQQELQLRYFLAASLISFKGKTFTNTDPDKLIDEKIEWLEKMPERIVSLLGLKLTEFDLQIQAIMTEGAVENF
jgi:hypothetical protein